MPNPERISPELSEVKTEIDYTKQIEQNMADIEALCAFLHVELDVQITPEAKKYILNYIESCLAKSEKPVVIFSIDNHQEHLDLLLTYYLILILIQDMPHLYPQILTVAAKGVWDFPGLKKYADRYVKNIETFDRENPKTALTSLLTTVRDPESEDIVNKIGRAHV